MENKIGYAYISLEDYKELIEDKVTLENINENLENELSNVKKEYENIEKTICNKVYENEDYHIKHYDGVGQYHHNELMKEFQRYGYIGLDKINELIQSLVERYKVEHEQEGSDEQS